MPHDENWKALWVSPVPEHGKPTRYGWTVYHPDRFHLGNYVDIGWGTFINAEFGVWLEDDVEIGPLCAILTNSSIDSRIGSVTVRKGAKIGAHCTVMPNVEIGEGATVGAHSFVKDDVPAGATAYGIPAKGLKRRTG